MPSETKKVVGGLVPMSENPKDLKFGAIYKLPKLEEIDDEFVVGTPLKLKNQEETDICTAASSTAVSEDQEEVELDMLFQFAAGKAIQIRDEDATLESWGCDLRSMAKSYVEYGSLEQKDTPFNLKDTPRAIYADIKNYPSELLKKAEIHKKESYMFISGPYDYFDNIRATLWKNRDLKKTMMVGTTWCPQWTGAERGIINFDGTPLFGHALKFFAVTRILDLEGEQFIEAQLSNGTDIGNYGYFYFTRSVVNKYFAPYGGVIFTDLPKEEARYYQDNGIKVEDSWFKAFFKQIINFIFNIKFI
jgi:hypothetical protein